MIESSALTAINPPGPPVMEKAVSVTPISRCHLGSRNGRTSNLKSNIFPSKHKIMEREKYGDAISYLPTPIIAIKQAVCFYCFQNSSSLSKCTACKRVAYCSSACQKKDWNEDHKKTCKILVFSNKGKVKTSPEGRTWQTYREEKVRALASHITCRLDFLIMKQWKDVKQFRAQNPGYHENQHRLMMSVAFFVNIVRA